MQANGKDAEIEIASISFAFKNGSIIKQLTARGTLLTNARFQDVVKTEDQINKILSTTSQELVVPIYAFIIFTNQEANERCQNYLHRSIGGKRNKNRKNFKFLGDIPIFKDAPEPTNIIWENLEITPAQGRRRKCFTYMVILIFIFSVFLLFTFLKSRSGKNKLMYPVSTDCKAIQSLFTDNQGEVNLNQFLQFATRD